MTTPSISPTRFPLVVSVRGGPLHIVRNIQDGGKNQNSRQICDCGRKVLHAFSLSLPVELETELAGGRFCKGCGTPEDFRAAFADCEAGRAKCQAETLGQQAAAQAAKIQSQKEAQERIIAALEGEFVVSRWSNGQVEITLDGQTFTVHEGGISKS